MWAAVSVLTVAALAGIGTLAQFYRDSLDRRSLDEYTSSIRVTVSTTLDFTRLRVALLRLALDDRDPAAAMEEVVDAADLLHARIDGFWSWLRVDGGATHSAVEQAVRVPLAAVDAVIAGEPGADPLRAADEIESGVRLLVQVYELRRQAYVDALLVREAEFRSLLLGLMALCVVLIAVAWLVSLLWQREAVAHRRRLAAEEEARFLAYHDPLTRLFNRPRFASEFDRILAMNDCPMLLLLDLDEFKEVNDRFGHAAGDRLLCAVADRLAAAAASQGGVAARLGGDEFALALPGPLDRAGIERFVSGLYERLHAPVAWETTTLEPKTSIGIADPPSATVARPPDAAEIMRAADFALYEAKAAGRNTWRLYDGEMARRVAIARELREAMPHALAGGEFRVFYQPQVRLADRSLHGFEALVRWQRGGALVPPSEFIAIAEESGFILELDLWVLRRALADAVAREQAGAEPVHLSVNLSALHFRRSDVVGAVRAALAESRFDPARLTLEITESVLIDDWDTARATLAALHGLGPHIALDDFGTGYSSMVYLRHLAVHEVKIDRSFLRDIESSDKTRMMLDGLVDIVAGLGMRLVIEGIETEAEARTVAALGASIGQGYLYGLPEPPEARFSRPPARGSEAA